MVLALVIVKIGSAEQKDKLSGAISVTGHSYSRGLREVAVGQVRDLSGESCFLEGAALIASAVKNVEDVDTAARLSIVD